eukprot:TRINITY_DN8567_c0_g1_i1.p1 TRINITY_DN8567_c0_g1~~TRINITY_DN8567_c0_g1_i1.p1  ORF type:complete len:337 (-),score=38.81 TRINITY_DN8567_c0_g1_i1:475-1485(-)
MLMTKASQMRSALARHPISKVNRKIWLSFVFLGMALVFLRECYDLTCATHTPLGAVSQPSWICYINFYIHQAPQPLGDFQWQVERQPSPTTQQQAHEPIYVFTSSGADDILLNFMCSFQRLKMTNLRIVPLDNQPPSHFVLCDAEQGCSVEAQPQEMVQCLRTKLGLTEDVIASAKGADKYSNLPDWERAEHSFYHCVVSARDAFVLRQLQLGNNFMVNDVDMVWVKASEIWDHYVKEYNQCDMMVMADVRPADLQWRNDIRGLIVNKRDQYVSHAINMGFYYIRSNHRTIRLFEKLVQLEDAKPSAEQEALMQAMRALPHDPTSPLHFDYFLTEV